MEKIGDAIVFGSMGWDDDGLGAEAERLGHRLCRVAAEDAGFIGGGSDDTSAITPANEDGFADEVWVEGAFDGDEEGIEIEMGEAPREAGGPASR
jgi:hypothetical protein